MNKGFIISFEGGEGSGKSTVIKYVEEYMKNKGIDFKIVREPGGSLIAEKIRELLLSNGCKGIDYNAELLLYIASRLELLHDVTIPALNEGKIVVYDRYIDSSIVYQGVVRGLGIDKVIDLHNMLMADWFPKYSILLDVEAEVGLKRATKDGVETNRFEDESIEFHRKVNRAYKELFTLHRIKQPSNIEIINANRVEEEVHKDVIRAVANFISMH